MKTNSPPPLNPEGIEKVLTAAGKAGKILLDYYFSEQGTTRRVKSSPVDFVTEADIAAEKSLRDDLGRAFPDWGMLGEEGGFHGPESEYYWVVDPLDGTTNFSHHHPLFCVSIGLARRPADGETLHQPVFGLIHVPFLGETIWVEPDNTLAWNRKGPAPRGAAIPVELAQSLIATGFPYNRREKSAELLANLEKIMLRAHGIRRGGSACLDLVWTALGRVNGFYETSLRPWDLCAGVALVRAAGGVVCRYDGTPFDLYGGQVVAGPRNLVNELVELQLADTAS